MAQNFPDIQATDLVSASRQNILDRDSAVKSSFAGTAYPTTDLVIGMLCYRTDLQKLYVLESTGPSVWREVQFAANLGTSASKDTGTSGNTVPLLDGANTWSALQTFSAGAALGAQSLTTSGGSLSGNTDLRLNSGPSKNINFLINSTSRMVLNADGGLVIGGATGGSAGAGTINAEALYDNGTLVRAAAHYAVGDGLEGVSNNLRVKLDGASLSRSASGIKLPDTGITAGDYTNVNVSVDAQGRITAIASGTTSLVITRQVFTADGAWTKPANLLYVEVEVQGGGGGGANLTDGNGATGGSSSFGAHCTANGGSGGNSPYGGAGGTATGGDYTVPGKQGAVGSSNNLDSSKIDGDGGDSFLGYGGKGGIRIGNLNIAAMSPSGYGGGGCGAGNTGGNARGGAGGGGYTKKLIAAEDLGATETVTVGAGGAVSGGGVYNDGTDGIVIVTEYKSG